MLHRPVSAQAWIRKDSWRLTENEGVDIVHILTTNNSTAQALRHGFLYVISQTFAEISLKLTEHNGIEIIAQRNSSQLNNFHSCVLAPLREPKPKTTYKSQ